MELADNIFKRKTCQPDKLVKYGFIKDNGNYIYSILIMDGQFQFVVKINDNEIKTEVIELALNEPFILYHVDNASNELVGKVRAEAEKVLLDIADKCFFTDVFKSCQAKVIINYVQDHYGDNIEFLWEKFPDNAIFRRQDNKKWYGALLTVERKKIGVNGDGTIEIVDLREDPEIVCSLVDGKTYFAGYHMNKKNWYTICLDESLLDNEIKKRIDKSYLLAKKK